MVTTQLDPVTVERSVRSAVTATLGIVPGDVTDDLPLTGDGAGDGAGTAAEIDHGVGARLISSVGETLDVRFPDDFLDGVRTYGDLVRAVRVSLAG